MYVIHSKQSFQLQQTSGAVSSRLFITQPQGAIPKATTLRLDCNMFTASPTYFITPWLLPPVRIQAPTYQKENQFEFAFSSWYVYCSTYTHNTTVILVISLASSIQHVSYESTLAIIPVVWAVFSKPFLKASLSFLDMTIFLAPPVTEIRRLGFCRPQISVSRCIISSISVSSATRTN